MLFYPHFLILKAFISLKCLKKQLNSKNLKNIIQVLL